MSGLGLLLSLFGAVACQGGDQKRPAAGSAGSLTLGAYSTPREAYGKSILPAFRRHRQKISAGDLVVSESYLGSGAQARAILAGFEADVAALSLEPDLEKLRKAGLITHDFKKRPYGGIVTRSIVVIGVRKGNPKAIADFRDLARPGIEVLTPNVRTSGGAMWNVLAIYGAAVRGHAGEKTQDDEAAVELLSGILRNVKVMDSGARDSMLTFERGVGDAIITYENEILVSGEGAQRHTYITPPSTIWIENPVAVVDVYAEKHGSKHIAQAFVDFLVTKEAQRYFADFGLRPVEPTVVAETRSKFAQVKQAFTVEDLGGWNEVQRLVFAEGGIYDRAEARAGIR